MYAPLMLVSLFLCSSDYMQSEGQVVSTLLCVSPTILYDSLKKKQIGNNEHILLNE